MELCKRQLTDSTFPWLLEVFLWLQSGQWNIKTQVMCETSGRECPFLLIFPFCLSVICVCVLSHCSCVQLFVALWTVARQAPLSMDSPHKNTGVGSPGGLSNLELKPGSSTLQDDSLWSEPPGKPSVIWMPMNFNSVIPPPKIEKYTISIFTQLVRDFRHWRTRSLIPSHILLMESGIPFRKHSSWDRLYNYCLPWEKHGITLPILPEGLQGNVTVIILECPLPKFHIHW